MVFASLTFLYFFLPANLLLYYLFPNKKYRNLILILFSFVFYAWGEPIWITLLFFSATVDYIHGLLVERYRGTPYAKWPLVSSICLNIGLLVAFKYSDFIYENVNALFNTDFVGNGFTLPIGISFYTFQTISYVADVYRGEIKAERSYLRFAMFVSLYHQLVAGPIVRYQHIAHEIDKRVLKLNDISAGMVRFSIGLFKKVAIANVAAQLLNGYIGADADLTMLTVSEAWFAIIMFSLQIYFDFSGYSDMAIGLGRMFGFHYQENFIYPYIAKSATEFWRRWHISLGTFFRDYIYIPLGGKYKRHYLNLLIVWGLTGLWHGASWNYILWGFYYGFLILIEKLFLRKILNKLPNVFSHVYLLFFAILGWVLFYFESIDDLFYVLKVMFNMHGGYVHLPEFTLILEQNIYWFILSCILCLPVYPFLRDKVMKRNDQISRLAPYAMIIFSFGLFIISTAMLVGKSYNPFLYFRF